MKYSIAHITWLLILVVMAGCRSTELASNPAPTSSEPRRLGRGTGEPIAGEPQWGLATLSVASAREKPEHIAEMATQVLLGHPVKLLEQRRSWFLVETEDGYQAWLEDGTFVRCSLAQVGEWRKSPLQIVTAWEAVLYREPNPQSEPVSDVIIGDLLKLADERNGWVQLELPDGRAGWLEAGAVEQLAQWQKTRSASPETIESTARRLLGRPYLWGGNSPKGLDCSGFTQLVYGLNGIALKRNSSQQALAGMDVPLERDLSNLRKGDLLFFGRKASGNQPERIFHVGIYLQDKLFIHSSERVQINSLDPLAPNRDEHRIRTLIRARRVL